MIDILIPKRRINRGDGVYVERTTHETQEDQAEVEQPEEQTQKKEEVILSKK